MLKELCKLDKKTYGKVAMRLRRGAMKKYIKDGVVFYDEDELKNFTPKRPGRKAKY